MISTSWVQSGILKKFVQDFQETTSQEITFERIRLQWNGNFELTGLFIRDHHSDTLAYIQKIQTSFQDFKKLQKSDFDFKRIEASGVYLNIKKYPEEEVHSLKILIQKLQQESQSRNKYIFNVGEVDFTQTKFNYTDLNTNRKPIQIDSLDVFAQNLNFTSDSLTLQLKSLKGSLNAPFQEEFETAASVIYYPGNLQLSDWELISRKNKLNGSLQLSGANKSFRNFNDQGTFELVIEKSSLDPKRIDPEKLYLNDFDSLGLQVNASGSINNFSVRDIKLTSNEFKLEGALKVQNPFDADKLSWELSVSSAGLNTQRLFESANQLKGFGNYFSSDSIQFNGNFISQNSMINFGINSHNTWGNFSVEGSLDNGLFSKNSEKKVFDLSANVESIDLFLSDLSKKKVKTGGLVQLKGELNAKENPELSWDIQNMYIDTGKLNLSNIKLEGNFKDRQLRNTLSIMNEFLILKSDLRFDFSDSLPQYTLAANVSKWDMNGLGIKLGKGKREFSGVILGGFKGKNIDDIEGEFKVSAAQITNENKVVNLNPITISKKLIEGNTELTIINTDCISGVTEGRFKTSQLTQLFQQTLHQAYPFLPQKQPEKGQELRFNLKIYKKLLDALYPEFSISENISLKGKIASDLKNSNVTLDAPLLRWNTLQLEKLHFQIDTKNPIYNTFLSVDRITQDYIKGRSFNMISTQLKDTLFFRSEFTNEAKEQTPFEINFYHTMSGDGTSFFGFRQSKFPLGKQTWILNPDDVSNQKISYNAKTKETILTDLLAVTEDQLIELSGAYLSNDKFQLDLDVSNVLLEDLLPNSPVFTQTGSADVKVAIVRSSEENQLDISATVADWNINGQQLGQFEFNAKGNTLMNAYVIDFNLAQNGNKEVSVQGVWQGLKDPKVNLNLEFDKLDFDFLSPLGKDAIQNIGGSITGSVNLWGPIDQLKHNGLLNLEDAQIRIPYLNLDYQAASTQVQLSNQDFIFKDLNLFEEAEGTSALLEGAFSHVNFRDWSLDMYIESDRMLLLNTPQEPESLFFGQGFLDGNLSLTGPTKNLKISLQGATEQGTSIKIPWAESYGLSDNSFVNFIDKNTQRSSNSETENKALKEIRGLEMDFELDVTNDASIEIVIDQETGSSLSGSGAGNLFMEINTNGKFNMWGDFITFDGIYNFKNLGVIDKKFNVKPGGTIVWEGNPLEAQMDLEAVYSVPGGANPALLLDNPNFNKSIPTEVLIRLQGNLLKPEDPVFEIDFPNTSGTVASEINYRLADPQRSQLQAISLLSQGIFINEVSVSMQGITNNLYQKASDIVSNLIGEDNDKLKVGIDYLQGDKSALLDIATEDRLGFTLSTKISDRILLNGKIGVPVGGVEQTLIVGNIQIDFILNDEGSLRAKVFNKENEFRYIGDELGYTQGFGLSYDVDFNTFKDLIRKVVTSQTPSEDPSADVKLKDASNEAVRFVKKN
ncbi:translocation/assembly module TamB [Flavobacteriaceae bacterium]|nr:translocation/assembly module TamB [Flavobacteriaceae bacterium]